MRGEGEEGEQVSARTVTVIETARESTGTPTPLLRHIVDHAPDGTPSDKCLCGFVWDRYRLSPDGPLCDPCKAEFRKRHPTWPFPGGAT